MTVTKEQALAFVEALTGYTAVADNGSDDCGERKSPHAATHLEAVLGQGNVANYLNVSRAFVKDDPKNIRFVPDRIKTEKLADYLEAVSSALYLAMKPQPEPNAGPEEF